MNALLSSNDCKNLLDAARIHTTVTQSHSLDSAIEQMFKRSYESWLSVSEKDSLNVDTSAGYGIFTGSFGLTKGSDTTKQRYDAMQTEFKTSSKLSESSYLFLVQSRPDLTAFQPWLECMKLTSEGITSNIVNLNNGYFTFNLSWPHPNGTKIQPEKVVAILHQNCTSDSSNSGNLLVGAVLKPGSSLAAGFKVINTQENASVTVIVSSWGTPLTETIKGINLLKPPIEIRLLARDHSGAGYMIYDSNEQAMVSAKDVGPENVWWYIEAQKAGLYRVKVLLSNPFGNSLKFLANSFPKDSNLTAAAADQSPFSFIIIPPNASGEYYYLELPKPIALVPGAPVELLFHAPFGNPLNLGPDQIRMSNIKEVVLTEIL